MGRTTRRDEGSLRPFFRGNPELRGILSDFGRQDDITPENAVEVVDGKPVFHTLMRWLDRTQQDQLSNQLSKEQESVDYTLNELLSHAPKERPAVMGGLIRSWTMSPKLVGRVAEKLPPDIQLMNADQLVERWKQLPKNSSYKSKAISAALALACSICSAVKPAAGAAFSTIIEINPADARIVGIDGGQHALFEKLPQRMRRVAGHRAGLHVAGRTALQADAAVDEKFDQRRIFDGADAMPDALRAQQADGIPDTFRARGLAGMNGDMQAGVAHTWKMLAEKLAREIPPRRRPDRWR